jgi:GH24 family phage-related lysozyme (muramidase)
MIKVKINMREMAQIERAVTRLTGDRAGAARFRRELTAAVQKEAVKAEPQIMAELVAEKIKKSETGWANDPTRNKAVLVEPGTGCIWLDSKGKPILGPRVTYPKTPDIALNAFIKHLKDAIEGEKFVEHMYLDKKGNVTVGIGFLLETTQEAMSLPFVEEPSMKPAHAKHVENAYNKVKRAPAGGAASEFANMTNIIISEADATILTLDFIDKLMIEIRSNALFPAFDTFPVPANQGILDMVYVLGGPKTRRIFDDFTAAVNARKWALAGQESSRKDVNAQRNQKINGWFQSAAKLDPLFLDPTCKKPLFNPRSTG